MALQLDARQRAMLEEMHIRIWAPEESLVAPVASVAPVVAAEILQPMPAAPAVVAPRPVAAPVAPPPMPRAVVLQDGRAEQIAAMDWPTLQATVAGCQACKLCETRKNTVFGVGPPTADSAEPAAPPRVDWLIVGEAPGEQEDLRGEPFVGQAGKLLDNMLRAVGVSRHGDAQGPAQSAFIVNVLKCRPPGNRNPELGEVAQCEPYLKRQIALLQPKVILGVGRFAVQSLLAASVPDVQTTPLGRLRGKVYRNEGVPVVVSYHPAYLLRSPSEKARAWQDLKLAAREL